MTKQLCWLLVVFLPGILSAQPPNCAGYTVAWAWDESGVAGALGGGGGPEDIAWNPITGTLFVAHDQLGSNQEILLEYDLNGRLLQSNAVMPGAGGLCAVPGSMNLLTTAGSTITEVDGTGAPVVGGIGVTIPGYGNIQDLDFDAGGALWVHNGNTGDVSTVDLVTGANTTRFTLGFGSQCLTFLPNGNLAFAAAFFNNGGNPTGTYFEVDVSGTIVCQSAPLVNNVDPCVTGSNFTLVNGMTWIASLNELAISSFFLTNGINIGRLAPVGSAFLGSIGAASVRADGVPFTATASGDAVIGSGVFGLTLNNIYPGDTAAWALSFARDCNNVVVGVGTLYVDLFPPNLVSLFYIPVVTPTLTIPISLATVPPSAAGLDVYTQFGGTDLGSPTLDILLSNCVRIRLDLM